jgi:hypothetical protein
MALSGASFLPDPEQVIHGNFGCSWIEAGAVLVMRQGGPSPPLATWIIGRDEASPDYRVLYSDGRGVSRIYAMSLTGNKRRLWRDHAGFSQRFEATVSDDRNSIAGHWEKSSNGQGWEHDFYVAYSRSSSLPRTPF